MARIDWKKIVHKALGFLINEGEKEVSAAVRKALESHNVHTASLTVEQYDNLKTTVQTMHDALSAEV